MRKPESRKPFRFKNFSTHPIAIDRAVAKRSPPPPPISVLRYLLRFEHFLPRLDSTERNAILANIDGGLLRFCAT